MNRITTAAAMLAASTSFATAGGIDRSGQFLGPLFEKGGETGSYAQLSFGSVNPSAPSNNVGDATQTYQQFGGAFKMDINDKLSFALIVDQPFGADIFYTTGLFNGGRAQIESTAITGVLRYKLGNGFSVHGGLRAQELHGTILTGAGGAGRLLTAGSDLDVGYLAGVAYERPDIALRVSLTYNSEIDQGMTGPEIPIAGGVPAGAPVIENFTVTTPASWNLEFQTGIAPNTLLFGSVRYVEWAGFNLTTSTGQYANFTADTTTYSLGVGRRFNENWAGAITLGFEEPGTRPTTTPLAPTTGSKSIGLGVTYSNNGFKTTAGVTYAELGDQTFPASGTSWSGSKAIGAGIRFGVDF